MTPPESLPRRGAFYEVGSADYSQALNGDAGNSTLAELRPLTGALADVEAKLHVAEQLAEAGKTHAQQLSETETQSANLRKVLPAYPQSADS